MTTEQEQFQQKHLMLAIPAYTGQVHMGTMRSIIADMLLITDAGHKLTINDDCGNAMIADCRAKICADFLASDCTDLIFIDSDVMWEKGALLKLLLAPVDFVAAVYPQRKDPINFCVRYLPDRKELRWDEETHLLEVDGVPAGCMRLSRAMLEKMIAAYPETEFLCEGTPLKKAWDIFGSYWEGKLKFGEDYSFCQRWRKLGGQIWVDPYIEMGHCGFKTFFGSLGRWLRDRPETAAAIQQTQLDELTQAVEKLEGA